MGVILAGLISCEDNPVENPVNYTLLFTENPVLVGPNGGEVSTTVVADVEYSLQSLSDWITDLQQIDKETVSFNVSANSTESTRDGKIAFHVAGTKDVKELVIRQPAVAKGLEVSTTSLSLEVKGGSTDVTVKSQLGWDVISASDWIVAAKKNASAMTVSADVNYTGAVRTGEVMIGTSTEQVKIVVMQLNDNALFCGATTEMGRRFVYNSGLVNTVTTDKSYSLSDGVDVLEIKYTSKTSGSVLPYYVYLFEIDLSSDVSIVATNKNDDDVEIKKTEDQVTGVQTMREQLVALQNVRGVNVLGGINGDFFFGEGSTSTTHTNSLLHGVMYKRGVCLKDTFDGGSACTAFAIMKDGTARILTQSAYKSAKADIQEAIGGRQEVLSSGTVTSAKNNKYDPRTAIGVSADRKKVVMVVVDGRRSSHSNGAEYSDLGKMLKAMGAYNGINLDGGGSSTFVVKETSGFSVRNKPSNDVERAVVNGLAIISK